MKYVNYLYIIFFSLLCFSSQLIIGYIFNGNNIYRFLPYAFICFFLPVYVFKKYKNCNKITILIIFLIPTLFTFSVSLFAFYLENHIIGLPLAIIGIVSIIVAYFFYNLKQLKKYSKIYILIILVMFYGYCNWLLGSDESVKYSKFTKELQIKNSNNIDFELESKKGKVLVFDLWSTSCGVCFKEFPEFEKLYEKYKDDPEVELYSLNLPLKRDSTINIEKFVKKYKFEKLYANNIKSWELLNNNSVPKIIMLDKKGEIRYKGSMNTNKYLIYNNFHLLIKKLKK